MTTEPSDYPVDGFGFAVGSGFVPGEYVKWTTRSDDGLEDGWDTNSFEGMIPDEHGGFGFGLGAAGADRAGHSLTATIEAASCTAAVSWRVVSHDQVAPPQTPAAAECEAERPAIDRVDDSGLRQVHPMYAIPSDAADYQLDLDGTIERSITGGLDWLRQQLGGSTFRLDTCQGKPDVSFVTLPRLTDEYARMRLGFTQGVMLDLQAIGYVPQSKIYAIYWGGKSQWARLGDGCGGESGFQGAVFVFLRDKYGPNCRLQPGASDGPGEVDLGMVHEFVHAAGLVDTCASNFGELGHVTDVTSDLMYAGPNQQLADQVDADHDDYYDHHIPGCRDLADSAFLDPLPANPELPPEWPAD